MNDIVYRERAVRKESRNTVTREKKSATSEE